MLMMLVILPVTGLDDTFPPAITKQQSEQLIALIETIKTHHQMKSMKNQVRRL